MLLREGSISMYFGWYYCCTIVTDNNHMQRLIDNSERMLRYWILQDVISLTYRFNSLPTYEIPPHIKLLNL